MDMILLVILVVWVIFHFVVVSSLKETARQWEDSYNILLEDYRRVKVLLEESRDK